jgi:endogenous inhibitor of DNA gyrase (YacG/DUF329 family)
MTDDPAPSPKPSRLKPCPICGKLAVEAYRPFCSARCKQVDLHRWLSGRYAIPVVDEPDEDDPGA